MRPDMKPRQRLLPRAALGIAVACTVLVLGRSISMASDPLCSAGSNSGTVCYIDSNGCEIQQGIGQSNFCNSGGRPDGGIVIVQHVANDNGGDGALPGGQFPLFASSGASAYATLYCSSNGQAAAFR